jgi:hypothetical protein
VLYQIEHVSNCSSDKRAAIDCVKHDDRSNVISVSCWRVGRWWTGGRTPRISTTTPDQESLQEEHDRPPQVSRDHRRHRIRDQRVTRSTRIAGSNMTQENGTPAQSRTGDPRFRKPVGRYDFPKDLAKHPRPLRELYELAARKGLAPLPRRFSRESSVFRAA